MKRNEFQPTRPVPLNGPSYYFHQGSFGYSPISAFSMPVQHNAYSPLLMVTPMDTPMEDGSDDQGRDDSNNGDQEMFVFDEQMERQNQFGCCYQQGNGFANGHSQNQFTPCFGGQNTLPGGQYQSNGGYGCHQNGNQLISTQHINQCHQQHPIFQQCQLCQPNYNDMNVIQRSALSDVGKQPQQNVQYFGNTHFNESYTSDDNGAFHHFHNAQKQQMGIQHSSMPQHDIESIRETPISVRDFGIHDVDDDYSEDEYDDFEGEGYSDDDDFDDDFNEADEVFQEVMETMEELKRIGNQNNRLLHNMIESQK